MGGYQQEFIREANAKPERDSSYHTLSVLVLSNYLLDSGTLRLDINLDARSLEWD